MFARRRGLTALVAGAAVCAALAACAGPGSATGGSGGKTINIGFSLPLTGSLASVAQAFRVGMDTCVAGVNAAGGANGYHINVNEVDDGYNPQRALTAARKFVQQDQDDIVATYGTSTTAAVNDFMHTTGVPYFPFAGIKGLFDPVQPNVFTVQPTYQQDADFALKYVQDKLKPKKANIFYAQLEGMTEGAADVKNALTGAGVTVGFDGSYQLGSISNFDQVVQNLAKGSPDVVFLFTSAADGAQIVKGLRANGVTAPVVGNVTFADPLMVQLAGSASKDVYGVAAQALPGAAGVKDIESKITSAHPGAKITGYNLSGYGWCQVVTQAIAHLKTSGRPTKAEMVQAFDSVRDYRSPVFPPITFTPQHHQGISSLAMAVSDGQTVRRISDYQSFD